MEYDFKSIPSRVTPAGGTKTLTKALWLLTAIGRERDGLTLTEASRLCGLPTATAFRVLGSLVDSCMLRLEGGGTYKLGPQCLVLGTAFLDGLDLREMAHSVLTTMADQTDETCHLGILDGNQVVYIDKVESQQAVQMASRVGLINPLHSSGVGKAILAYCTPGQITSVIDAGLERRTSKTITDPERLRGELELIYRKGYAIDDGENEEGIRCVAAPVFDHSGEVVAAISIAGPAYRMSLSRLRDLSGVVQAGTRELSDRIGHPGRRDSQLGSVGL